MARGAAAFRQSDLMRALRAARAAGIEVARITIGTGGIITIDAAKPTQNGTADDEREANEWDSLHR